MEQSLILPKLSKDGGDTVSVQETTLISETGEVIKEITTTETHQIVTLKPIEIEVEEIVQEDQRETVLEEGELDIVWLANELTANTGIATLELSDSGLTTEEVVIFAKSLEVNTTLEELNVSDNNITEEGLLAFARAIRLNKTLRELKIGTQPGIISDKIELELASAIESNKFIIVFTYAFRNSAAALIVQKAIVRNEAAYQLRLHKKTTKTIYFEELTEVKTVKKNRRVLKGAISEDNYAATEDDCDGEEDDEGLEEFEITEDRDGDMREKNGVIESVNLKKISTTMDTNVSEVSESAAAAAVEASSTNEHIAVSDTLAVENKEIVLEFTTDSFFIPKKTETVSEVAVFGNSITETAGSSHQTATAEIFESAPEATHLPDDSVSIKYEVFANQTAILEESAATDDNYTSIVASELSYPLVATSVGHLNSTETLKDNRSPFIADYIKPIDIIPTSYNLSDNTTMPTFIQDDAMELPPNCVTYISESVLSLETSVPAVFVETEAVKVPAISAAIIAVETTTAADSESDIVEEIPISTTVQTETKKTISDSTSEFFSTLFAPRDNSDTVSIHETTVVSETGDIIKEIITTETHEAVTTKPIEIEIEETERQVVETVLEENELDLVLLAQELTENTGMATLVLSDDGLTAEEIVMFAKALEVNHTLEKLNIEGNDITEEGFLALIRAIRVNKTLREIIIGTQQIVISEKIEEELASALEVNEYIVVFKYKFRNAATALRVQTVLTRNQIQYDIWLHQKKTRTVYVTEKTQVTTIKKDRRLLRRLRQAAVVAAAAGEITDAEYSAEEFAEDDDDHDAFSDDEAKDKHETREPHGVKEITLIQNITETDEPFEATINEAEEVIPVQAGISLHEEILAASRANAAVDTDFHETSLTKTDFINYQSH
ncbi:hypothetical protein HK100_007813 [Physocladia obscura]|uniref:Uncharacterized protein n=1 Tax=Physocladia obscura TaxID=109957 RepID=A0AAD5T5H2_9FUNG|nr:hypothetical protein HK100_007813 [Physocladia obscura]